MIGDNAWYSLSAAFSRMALLLPCFTPSETWSSWWVRASIFHYSFPSPCASLVFTSFRWSSTLQPTVASPSHLHFWPSIAVWDCFSMSTLEVIPPVRTESLPVFKHFSVSIKVLSCFLLILLSLRCGMLGVIDMCFGIGIGVGLLRLQSTYSFLQRFPPFLPQLLCVSYPINGITHRKPSVPSLRRIQSLCEVEMMICCRFSRSPSDSVCIPPRLKSWW